MFYIGKYSLDLLHLLKQGDSQYRDWVFPNSTRLAYVE